MNAIVINALGGPDVLKYEYVPRPVPMANDVLVEIKAAAVNRRDLSIRTRDSTTSMLPLIPGTDGAGVVAAKGDCVAGCGIGQKVIINPALFWGASLSYPSPDFRILGGPDPGTYAEFIVVPAENIYPKPENLSFVEAAASPVGMLTAWRALITKAAVSPGDRVLIPGIGSGVATFALQIAKLAGAVVFVTSHSETKLAMARQLGADATINYRTENWVEDVQTLTAGKGIDIFIDSVGEPTIPYGLDLLKPGGKLITFGATVGALVEINLRTIYHKHISILGTTLGSPQEFDQLLRPLADDKIKPVIDSVYPLSDAARAHQRLESGDQFGKVVLKISED